ncbi:hypothetical protein [Nocardiopsis aegyptia]|nr:hypothetical protein [Nocardiopsis aegyptia]
MSEEDGRFRDRLIAELGLDSLPPSTISAEERRSRELAFIREREVELRASEEEAAAARARRRKVAVRILIAIGLAALLLAIAALADLLPVTTLLTVVMSVFPILSFLLHEKRTDVRVSVVRLVVSLLRRVKDGGEVSDDTSRSTTSADSER